MKKVFNWLGWLIVGLFVFFDLLLFFIGVILMKNGNEFGVYTISCSLILVIVGAALLPIWYNWALGKLLPIQQDMATVILKETSVSHSQDATGPELTIIKKFITFELLNGDRLCFKIAIDKYYTILIGECGTLTYKMQGKHTYFIDFKKQ